MINGDAVSLPDVITQVGQLGAWMQAIGVIAVIAIVGWVFDAIMNRLRFKEIKQIREDMLRIEGKIDTALKKR